jgi:hypothetical protein
MILSKLIKFVTLSVVALTVMPCIVAAGPNVAVLAFGLVGSESVFESEAKGAAAILAQRLGAHDVVARPNTKTRRDVTIEAIGAAVRTAVDKMDSSCYHCSQSVPPNAGPVVARSERKLNASSRHRQIADPNADTAVRTRREMVPQDGRVPAPTARTSAST